MKRWERNYIKFTVFLIIVLGIIAYMFRKHIDVLPMNKCQFFKNAFLLLIGVSVLIIMAQLSRQKFDIFIMN